MDKNGLSTKILIFLSTCILLFDKAQSQCDGTGTMILYATSYPQYLTSPNYPENYPAYADCSWRIVAPSTDDKIIINIEDFNTDIRADYMTLYDGYDSSATLVISMEFTNREDLNAFVSSGDVLFITFESDFLLEYSGFQILYFTNDTANQPPCDTVIEVTSEEQVLMSPNLPNPYNEFDICGWDFIADTGILFQIKFLDLGNCFEDRLIFYHESIFGPATEKCSTALVYEFDNITTTWYPYVEWRVTYPPTFYGFMLVYSANGVSTQSTSSSTTTTTAATTTLSSSTTTTTATTTTAATTTTSSSSSSSSSSTTTTTTATTTTTTTATTTLPPGIFDNCIATGAYMNATISPNFDYLYSPEYESGTYPSNKYCRWYITAPDDYAVEAYFDNQTFAIERNIYCRYDYVIFYNGNSTTDPMLNKFCGFIRPETVYRSSSTEMLIVFSSDYIIEYAGFRIRIRAVENTYPGCRADYTTYPVMYNREFNYLFNNFTYINNISTPGFGVSYYSLNVELFWLFTNTNSTYFRMVLDIIDISIERSRDCIYDRLILYNGPCIKDDVLDTICGYWAKQWYLDGDEFLLHFHSDGYLTQSGFLINYYADPKNDPTEAVTSTTTFGPPVGAVVDAVKEMLTNYSNENLPTRDLSEAIRAYVDFYFVGINGLDEVEQKLTSTGQFEVRWEDPSLSWDPTKRQGVVQVLLPQNDVWKPDIALMNGFSKITAMGAKFMFIDINYNGSCIWKPYQVMDSVCKVDMTHYPYDRQICILKFGTWSTDDSQVVTELGTLGLQIHPNFQENTEWRLITTETKQEISDHHKVVEFYLTLERNSKYVTYYMTIPLIMLAYMNVFVFAIPTESGEKSGYSITIFLSFVVLLIINNQSLPDNSDTISLYAAYVLTMTILSGLALIISVLQIRAITFEERRYPISKRFKTMIKFVNKIKSLLPCVHRNKNTGDKHDIVEEIEIDPSTTEHDDDISEREGAISCSRSSLEKKRSVSFKINREEHDIGNERFSLPRNRKVAPASFDRETTLFEKNAFIRQSSLSSFDIPKSSKTQSYEKEILKDKTVTVEDESNNEASVQKTSQTTDEDMTIDKIMPLANSSQESENNGSCKPLDTSIPDEQVSNDFDRISESKRKLEISKENPADTNVVDKDVPDSQKIESGENQNPSPSKEQFSADADKKITHRVTQNVPIYDSNVGDSVKKNSVRFAETEKLETRDSTDTELIQTESAGQHSRTLVDEITAMQPATVVDVKMNRPISATENRPVSVNRISSTGGNDFALASNGRAVTFATSRPVTRDNRAISVLSERPISVRSRTRPTSVISQNETTDILFGTEDHDRKTPQSEMDKASEKSEDLSSESLDSSSQDEGSDKTGDDIVSWPELVSSIDVLFFIIYLFVTTLMSLALFLTMIQAY